VASTPSSTATVGLKSWLLVLAALAILALQVAGFHSLRHDDAFISFRYGQNLANGNGLVFNPGERSMASTAPAHVLLSAAGYALVGKERLPSLMSTLGCLGWFAQAAAVFFMLRRALGDRGAAFVALGIAFGAAWSHRFVALETNLVMACVLWGVVSAIASRWLAAAALVALAGLFRPDAYLVAIPLGVACIRELRAAAWRPAVLGLALSAPWYLFAVAWFGSVLPNSLANKVGTVALLDQVFRIASYLGTNFFTPTISLEIEESLRIASHPPGLAAGATWLLALAGAVGLIRRQHALWLPAVCLLLYLVAYLTFRMEIGFEWHLYPALLFVTIFALSGLTLAVESLPAGRGWTLAGSLMLAAIAAGFLLRTAHYSQVYERAFWFGARDAAYREVADYLYVRARPGDVVAANEVGTIAYYSEAPMLDLLGLVTPSPEEAARRLGPRLRWVVDLPAYSRRPRPDAVFRAESEPIHPDELFPPGRDRFSAAVVVWNSQP